MKSSDDTVTQRVEDVLKLRLAGALFHEIRQYASSEEKDDNGVVTKGPWHVSDRQIQRYIRASDTLIAQTLDKDRQRIINLHRARHANLFSRALAVNDYATALRVMRNEEELLGLIVNKNEHSGKDGKPIAFIMVPGNDSSPRSDAQG